MSFGVHHEVLCALRRSWQVTNFSWFPLLYDG